ncbi:hypothetical protein Cni_G06484 [Canna indica]|uniref:SPARK domain-containing protein n=1 Tax=Canna indica TaxID=4628 RepID=A0AAQ3JXC0_9LILI|nr:hypothetical protein Cni_G06484 [Canna indica]
MARFLPLLLLFQASLLAAQPAREHPEPASILVIPAATTAANSSSTSSSRATIPAFPEQSDVSAAACPLDPPADLLPSVSAACSSSDVGLPSRSRCCPALNAWILAAYSATALAAHPLRPAAASVALPALPDDSESCIGSAERELRHHGAELPRVNATCDVAYCFCGIRLRRFACAEAFVADAKEGRWVPAGDARRRLVKDCSRPGFAGCTRCLGTLNQLRAKEKQRNSNTTRLDNKDSTTHGTECQLMGLTWLLSKNRTLFMPTAASVLRAIMAADQDVNTTSCSLAVDDMPLAVGSDQISSPNCGCFAVGPVSLLLTLILFALVYA